MTIDYTTHLKDLKCEFCKIPLIKAVTTNNGSLWKCPRKSCKGAKGENWKGNIYPMRGVRVYI